MERLILFDIDGTILTTDGVAAGAFREALEEVFGTSGPREGYSFAGKTDPQIARELLTSGEVAARAWLAGESAPRFQQAFARRARRPVRSAGLVWSIAERPAGGHALAAPRVPGVGQGRAAPRRAARLDVAHA